MNKSSLKKMVWTFLFTTAIFLGSHFRDSAQAHFQMIISSDGMIIWKWAWALSRKWEHRKIAVVNKNVQTIFLRLLLFMLAPPRCYLLRNSSVPEHRIP